VNGIAQQIRQFVSENFLFGQGAEQLKDSDSFLDNGIIDSTGVLELVTFLEEKFPVTIADEELVPDNLDSIDNLVRFLESKLHQAKALA
jgi:acyl carrier protein